MSQYCCHNCLEPAVLTMFRKFARGISLLQSLTRAGAMLCKTVSLALLALLAMSAVAQADNNWSGANSYFLWALSDSDRGAHLRALANANIKVIRIFVVHIGNGDKSTSASGTPDVEEWAVGSYQDGILSKIDKLMYECSQLGLKLNIVLHDRYSLGTWQHDGYTKKYGDSQNPVSFYQNAGGDFDNRIRHILAHKNPYFNNKAWANIPEAIWAFGVQNEGRGHMDSYNGPWTWFCDRAAVIRPAIDSKIFVTTGGGYNWRDSLQDANFQCKHIDVIGLHSYDGYGALTNNLPTAINKAKKYGKRVIYEEFGSTGNAQAGDISSQGAYCNSMGVPWFPWQFINAKSGDYEYYTNSNAWNTHVRLAAAALKVASQFTWAGFNYTNGGSSGNGGGSSSGNGGGNSGNKGDWDFCTTSSECSNGCCSSQYSGDGKTKCTPNGTKCVTAGGNKGDWEFCSSSSECSNKCCSSEYSNDGKPKCTPGGSRCR
ncbi:hypothetical protein PROFUN_14244 [Planoprotostelium fungivorum]|uniref:Glycoside hydrolase family 5 domain-containing protein n=1 Tax=Planoprotostelium fungivorum TaxID=1890364 RepID=A0A2P6N5N5_9EUKA|nr:hypothetical protein PROFUN_14244 [Planoprotostelium fungivorum]